MNWRAVYESGLTLTESDCRYADIPREHLTAFQMVEGDSVLFETRPPEGADGYDLRYRFRGEMSFDGQPGAQRYIIGWEGTGPVFLLDVTGIAWIADEFHDACTESCQHPNGWFDAPVLLDSERRSA